MSIKIDVIDHLVGIVPGSSLDLIRRRRVKSLGLNAWRSPPSLQD
ncbi:hypothetical protein [Bradyrhizobium sp.]|jgi:hypothetical protein